MGTINDSALLLRQPIVNRNQETQGYNLTLLSPHGESAATGGVAALLKGAGPDESFFSRLANRFALVDCAQMRRGQDRGGVRSVRTGAAVGRDSG